VCSSVFKLSLRDWAAMMAEGVFGIAYTPILRWVQHYTVRMPAPKFKFFNVFDTPNFTPPNATLKASPAFLPSSPGGAFPSQIVASGPSQITGIAIPMRQIQFGLKVLF
jgi:hypothetical protein